MKGDILKTLRAQMVKHGVAAYYVPSVDPHYSEYTPEKYKRIAAVSGFTGSAGTVVVTPNKALLWTDGRYWIQAAKELSDEWTLMKQQREVPTVEEWLSDLEEGAKVGFDPQVVTVSGSKTLSEALEQNNVELFPVLENLVDAAWESRPKSDSTTKIFALEDKYSGKPSAEKVKAVVEHLKKKRAASVIFSSLDEIAWLFNLRGDDILYTPVFLSYAIVTSEGKAHLFADLSRLPAEARAAISEFTAFAEYDSFWDGIKRVCKAGSRVLLDDKTASIAIKNKVVEAGAKVVNCQSCVAITKAVKNETEVAGFIECHKRDGFALTSWMKWVEDRMAEGTTLTECTAADKLEWFRSQEDLFMGLSFPSISVTGPNAAIIHARAVPETCANLSKDKMYLIDSGGQYKDGTTDVTRTMCFGEPKPREVEAYTLVLKGHIALNLCKFPKGTMGSRLDVLARKALWEFGLDYGHGTGHGVGHFLGVHEGPISIGTRSGPSSKPLEAGNVVSNEPGFYLPDGFGIRIENLELVVKAQTKHSFNDTQYYKMQSLTIAPLDAKLIDTSLLTSEEVEWINAYHKTVLSTLSPRGDAAFKSWLQEKCKPLKRKRED